MPWSRRRSNALPALSALTAFAALPPRLRAARSGSSGSKTPPALPIRGYLARPSGAGPVSGGRAAALLPRPAVQPSRDQAASSVRASGAVRRRVLDPRAEGDLQRRFPGPCVRRLRSARLARSSSPTSTRSGSPSSGSHKAGTGRWRPRLRPPAGARPVRRLSITRRGGLLSALRQSGGAAARDPDPDSSGRRDEVTRPPIAGGSPRDRARRAASVYPGVGHCFDDPAFAGGKQVLGMPLGYDAGAARRGMAELIAFLHDSLAH